MSLRKLSGAAAAGSRVSYADSGANTSISSSAGGPAGNSTGSSAAAGTATSSSKAYSSHLAVQSDATKYRGKYKELKKKVRQIEGENDRLHLKTLRIKRNIQRMRLERAILYERLEAELSVNGALEAVDEGPNNVQAGATRGQAGDSRSVEPSRSGGGGGGRRTLDYSPSPEDERPVHSSSSSVQPASTAVRSANGASSAKPEQPARASMKITLKRHSNAASHQQNGKDH